jgi:hypothetical protein
MKQSKSPAGPPVWLGQEAEQNPMFADGKLWIGQHASDQDILVFDPAEADPSAEVLSLYSLTQHRTRSFRRETVIQKIHPLTDELACARATKEYTQRGASRANHEQELAAARTAHGEHQRDGVIAAHRRYVEGLGLEYQGVRDTPANYKGGRSPKCHTCAIPLDDFAGSVCAICGVVLCSCGSCACGKSIQPR